MEALKINKPWLSPRIRNVLIRIFPPRKKVDVLEFCKRNGIIIDPAYYELTMSHYDYARLELDRIPLKKIYLEMRRWSDKHLKLNETFPYRYFSGEISYDQYHNEYGHTDNVVNFGRGGRTEAGFADFKRSIDENGFDERKVIVVVKFNRLLDGMHRGSYLAWKYGMDYEVPVLRVYRMPKQKGRRK